MTVGYAESHEHENGNGFDLTTSDEDWRQQQQMLMTELPELFPDIPALTDRFVNLGLANPYADNGPIRHAKIRDMAMLPEDGGVNGYIKFRLRMADVESDANMQKKTVFDQNRQLGKQIQGETNPAPFGLDRQQIPNLPPDFGRGLKLDKVDGKLLKFCKCGSLTDFYLANTE